MVSKPDSLNFHFEDSFLVIFLIYRLRLNFITKIHLIDCNFYIEVATINGFCSEIVKKMIAKMEYKNQVKENTTLKRLKENSVTRRSFNFNLVLTNKMKNNFKRYNIDMVFQSNCKLKKLLGTTKDKSEPTDKSGMYRARSEVCGVTYIGKCIRAIKPAFTEHVVKEHHFATKENFELIEPVNNPKKLFFGIISHHIT